MDRTRLSDPYARKLAAIIHSQNQLIAASENLDEVLSQVARSTQDLTGADGAVVELVEGDALVYRAATGSAAPHLGLRLQQGNTLSGRCLREAQALRCDDSEEDPRVDRAATRKVGLRSMIVVPLVGKSGTIGVLKVLSQVPNAFADSDTATLQLMSGLITAAISVAAERAVSDALVQHQQESARALAQAARDQSAVAEALAITASEKESTARALAQKSATFSVFFDRSPLMMGVIERVGSDDFRFLEVNEATGRTYALTPAQLQQRLASEVGLPLETRQRVRAPFDEATRTGLPARWEFARQTPHGLRHFSAMVAPAQDDTGEGQRFCYIIEDVTEAARLREQLEVQERMAAVGRLSAGVAHEVNNPLAYVLSNLGFLATALPALRDRPDEALWADATGALEEAAEGADRVREIVRDLYSFVGADRGTGHRELCDLLEIAERSAKLTSAVVLPNAQLLREPLGPAPVSGNAARLGQIVINLLANAAQAMPPERASGENRIVLRVGRTGGESFIEVEDNGAGIPRDVQARIFEPFFTTKNLGKGMGLGLSLCHNIAIEHGGTLTVKSEPGAGTVFRLALPAVRGA